MNDIPMGMKWVHKTNGKWVTVVATLPNDGHGEQVRISDRNGPQGRSREIDVDIDWFYDNFTPVNDPDEPHVGETWTMNSSHRQVHIKAVSEGYVVAQNPPYPPFVELVDDFLNMAERGVVKLPVPSTDRKGFEAMNFPILQGEISFGLARWDYTMNDKPWSNFSAIEGVVRVPLAWDRADTVPFP